MSQQQINLTQILINAQNIDINIRNQATGMLQKFQEQNLPMFLVQLVVELADDSKPAQARQMAGILLKNTLTSKDETKQMQLHLQWKQLPEDIKKRVRVQVLNALHSSTKEARRVAAQVLSKILVIELQQNCWGDVIQELSQNILKPKTEFGVESSLLALGYTCEESDAPKLREATNLILTAVVHGMNSQNNEIKHAATTALYNALEFIKANFQNEKERNYIMKVICETTLSKDVRVREIAMETIAKIAFLYYDYLKPYMEALFNITFKAAKTDEEPVALQAIEFWSTLAELESDLIEDIEFARERGEQPTVTCHYFIKAALKQLVDLLTTSLARQDEYQTEDDWNISAAAATCLALVSKVVGNDIVQFVMPFVSKNISNPDWHYREAAIMAFSAILNVPPSNDMYKLVDSAISGLLGYVKDKMVLVKDSTVFALGRIAQFHPQPLIEKHLDNFMNAMAITLQDEPRIASKTCWAIHNLAESFEQNDDTQTYPLSKYFEGLVKALIKTTERSDVTESNLRINCYAALNSLISTAPHDTYNFLEEIVKVFLQRLEQTLKQGSLSKDEKEQLHLVQALIIGSLQILTQKLDDKIKQYADKMMTLYLTVLRGKNVSVYEDTLISIASLASVIGSDFDRYMKPFAPFLSMGLRNHQAEQVCTVAVNIIGDLCTALGEKILPYCDELVSTLLQNLQSKTLSRNIKPGIIASFGDICLAIGGSFEKYLPYVAQVLKQAAEAKVDTSSEEMVEYLNMLRENILAAYTGILQGLKTAKIQSFNPYVDNLLNFLKLIAMDPSIDQEVFKNAVTVIGDLANVYGQRIKQFLHQEFIMQMVNEAVKSKDTETKKAGSYAKKQIAKLQ